MKARSALFLILLAHLYLLYGCGSGVDNNNNGYGFTYDVQGAVGIKLRFTPYLAATDALANVATLESVFAEVEACTGLDAPAPFIIVAAAGSLAEGTLIGDYLSDPPLILLDQRVQPQGDVTRHEMVHYLLHANTGDLDPAHISKLFLSRNGEGGCT